jgi:TRAP-type C4-dicarboxylate transport system substrate-binding protein
MALDAYEALPAAYKAALTAAKGPAYAAVATRYATDDATNVRRFEEQGLTAIRYGDDEIAAFEARAAEPVWEAWVAEQEAAGRPGSELLDLVLRVAGG